MSNEKNEVVEIEIDVDVYEKIEEAIEKGLVKQKTVEEFAVTALKWYVDYYEKHGEHALRDAVEKMKKNSKSDCDCGCDEV